MSDYITLDLAKSHLRVLHARDDSYIELLIKAALKAVTNFIDKEFSEIQQPDGSLPEDLVFAALLIIGDMYQNRAAQTDAALYVNIACERLMFPYRKMGV
ncbi:phage gp6-like head-tail connector protein [Acinetobacter baumannii]|uniref:Phage gp6-like head-tail connector protein n=1 Tax=Acinetobacter baumannii TaxID=470 RepID=A0AAP1QWP0_ACIBA|nr:MULTISPECIES: head-tail connector protein [Acinetobacter]HAV4232403.1 phage gp6-like head-tail connector protein [Acinetobacter baumannii ATCC 17978]EHU1962706.1 phage gp6-like head-tail connector protein [Acinetobacter baumannii]EHU2604704.1 phage gp6-like head-tail connector protein [Acinetobacter baumannii]EHU3335367.1 phage gp6-like head-tail connector protein [Acinetobacter baumannii]EIB6900992.1 phage gp6-like head-tail connector protein [Acinetobacter baumannii]